MKKTLTISFLLVSTILNAQLKIEGKISPSDQWERKLYIERIDRLGGGGLILVDSVLLRKDGAFSYVFQEDKQGMLYRFFQPLKNQKRNNIIAGTADHWFYISTAEKGSIKISAKADSLFYSLRVNSKGINQEILTYRDFFKPFRDISKLVEDSISLHPEKKQYLQGKYLPLAIDLFETIKQNLINSLDTCRNEAMLLAGLYYLDKASYGQIERKYLEKYTKLLTNDDVILIRNAKKLILEPEKNRIGIVLPNTEYRDRNNNLITLNSFKGKFKVLDFWASWCGPCRQANRTSLPKFHDYLSLNGIPLIGISIDEDKTKWKEAIVKDKTKWVQLIEETPLIQKILDIQGVPHYIVLDENNRVLFESSTNIMVEIFIKQNLGMK